MVDGMVDINLAPETILQQGPYQNDTNYSLDSSEMVARVLIEKPRKKRQRKADKPPKPPTEKKKRGRKPKIEKLMAQAATGVMPAGLPSQPGGEHLDWARASNSNVFLPGEMMNGPQHESVLVKDVNMRRASLESQLSEPPRVPPQTNAIPETALPSTTVRSSVLKSTSSGDGELEGHDRRLSSSSSHSVKDPPPALKSPTVPSNPSVISPTSKTPVRLSPFNKTEFPFSSSPYINYPNYPISYPHPPSSTSPGFGAGFAGQGQPRSSAGSSPTSTSSSGSIGTSSQKTVYESSFPAKSPPNIAATKLSESLGFNGFPTAIPSTTANYTKFGLDDSEMKVFNSDSENDEPSDSLEATDEEGAPLSPTPS